MIRCKRQITNSSSSILFIGTRNQWENNTNRKSCWKSKLESTLPAYSAIPLRNKRENNVVSSSLQAHITPNGPDLRTLTKQLNNIPLIYSAYRNPITEHRRTKESNGKGSCAAAAGLFHLLCRWIHFIEHFSLQKIAKQHGIARNHSIPNFFPAAAVKRSASYNLVSPCDYFLQLPDG